MSPSRVAARQTPLGLLSSSTNIASDHGVRERAALDGDDLRQVGVGEAADARWSWWGDMVDTAGASGAAAR